jgi:hypothetical protein
MVAALGGDAASSTSWQQKVFLASQYIVLGNEDSDFSHSKDFIELFGPIDNTSGPWYASAGETCIPCLDDKPLWWLVLRWLKMMLLKIARSYHAKPLLLIIAPLCVGLVFGYWLGGNSHSLPKRNVQQRKAESVSSYSNSSLISRILTCFWAIGYFFVSPFWDDQPRRNHSGQASLLEECISHENDTSTNQSTVLPAVNAPQSREDRVRQGLKGDDGSRKESGVEVSQVPKHVAVIMDGNRRYGKAKYGSAAKGHWDGSSKLVEFAKWCIAEEISFLTVYAFSTENWNREPAEVASLMTIFSKYCNELRVEALKRNIKILVLSTDTSRVGFPRSINGEKKSDASLLERLTLWVLL